MGQSKLKKIWFFSHCPSERLIDISKILDKSSFDSVLLPFKAGWPDPIIKSFAVLQNTKTLEAIAALPGYAASAEYVSMIDKSIKEFFPDRSFYLNIIDGGMMEDPSIFGINKGIDDIKDINEKFVSDLRSKQDVKLMFSGKSESTYQKMLKYGYLQLALLSDLPMIEDHKYISLCVRLFVCVKDTDEQAEMAFQEMINIYSQDKEFSQHLIARMKENIILGSKETVRSKIYELKAKGIAGILVSDLIGSNTEEEVIMALEDVL